MDTRQRIIHREASMNWRSFAHGWLEIPSLYDGLQWFIGATRERSEFLRNVGHFQDGEKVVDVGCGPGRILEALPPAVRYVGFDPNEAYIRQAQARYGARGTFLCGAADSAEVLQAAAGADAVMSLGVLHHLSDEQTEAVFRMAEMALRPGGRLIVYEPCFTDHDDLIGRILMRLDRGGYVRTSERWRELIRAHFDEVDETIRKPVLLFRYTIQTLVCKKT